jgi:hypothetical protein
MASSFWVATTISRLTLPKATSGKESTDQQDMPSSKNYSQRINTARIADQQQ